MRVADALRDVALSFVVLLVTIMFAGELSYLSKPIRFIVPLAA